MIARLTANEIDVSMYVPPLQKAGRADGVEPTSSPLAVVLTFARTAP